ncbi:hypothetical protein [Gimesia maris]|uniref:hypothetical protein n=1 Tax=Gimesia maris TaxID=122 RepID=UPI003A951A2F
MSERPWKVGRRPSFKIVVPVILFCTYYPYSWLILSKGTWTSYRWTWIKMWPALPGILPRALWFHDLSDGLALAGMYLISCLLIALMIYLAGLRSWMLVTVAVLLFVLSAVNSMIAYAFYRA